MLRYTVITLILHCNGMSIMIPVTLYYNVIPITYFHNVINHILILLVMSFCNYNIT